MTETNIPKPTTTITDVAKPTTGKEARFGIAKFSKARFGNPDATTDVSKPSTTFTDVARP